MKTTLDLPDSLFLEAKACARSRGVPFRQIVEEGLRAIIQSKASAGAFRMRDGSFGDVSRRSPREWTEIRQAIYEGRGE
jgi:hypothetical protein